MPPHNRALCAFGIALIAVWVIHAMFVAHSVITVTLTAWAVGHFIASALGVVAGIAAVRQRAWWIWPALVSAALAVYLLGFEGWAVVTVSQSAAALFQHISQFPKLAFVGIFMPAFGVLVLACTVGALARRTLGPGRVDSDI